MKHAHQLSRRVAAGLAIALAAAAALLGNAAAMPAPTPVFRADALPGFIEIQAPAPAPQPDAAVLTLGKTVWGPKGKCSFCHGWAGDGEQEGPSPPGPPLRPIALTGAQIREVAQCGRPGSAMPYHDARAYQDTRCYGVTKADLGDQMPTRGVALQPRELDAVVAYIEAKIKGRGEVTAAECAEFFGATAARCAKYKP